MNELHEEPEIEATASSTRDRNIVFVDEFLGIVIRKFKMTKLVLSTPDRPGTPSVEITGVDPYTGKDLKYIGTGRSIGHCLRMILDQVNETFPLGGEYYDLPQL